MNRFEYFRIFLNRIIYKQKPNERKIKRVFQWRRYVEWKDLTNEEKIATKRFLLLPIFAYSIIIILNQNILLIIFLFIGYFIYKNFEKDTIIKK
tara:strand:- start:328 stop:609 length:282 start_codon:yes stop_codon:yes gene_type:complete